MAKIVIYESQPSNYQHANSNKNDFLCRFRNQSNKRLNKNIKNILSKSVYLIVLISLFAGFQFNFWEAAEKRKFERCCRVTESFIVARMVMSSQEGIFSRGGLSGHGYVTYSEKVNADFQFECYLAEGSFPHYTTYNSHPGLQGILFSLMDRVSPLSKEFNLLFFNALTSFLLALVFSLFIRWIYLEAGYFPALLVFISIILSPWLATYGHHLWHQLWIAYLPFILLLYQLKSESISGRPSWNKITFIFSFFLFIGLMIRGFEHVSSFLFMGLVPVFYFWYRDKWPLRKLLTRSMGIILGSTVSLLLTLSILTFQISTVMGKFSDGIDYIVYSFLKRTHGGDIELPEHLVEQVESSYIDVFSIYLNGVAFIIPFKVVFYHLLIFFLTITLIGYFTFKYSGKRSENLRKLRTITLTTWISIMGPFSWFIIFKGHSYSHGHMDHIVWYLPFYFFGFMLTGYVFKFIFEFIIEQKRFIQP